MLVQDRRIVVNGALRVKKRREFGVGHVDRSGGGLRDVGRFRSHCDDVFADKADAVDCQNRPVAKPAPEEMFADVAAGQDRVTPAISRAALVSIDTICACGYGLAAKAAHNMPGRAASALYAA